MQKRLFQSCWFPRISRWAKRTTKRLCCNLVYIAFFVGAICLALSSEEFDPRRVEPVAPARARVQIFFPRSRADDSSLAGKFQQQNPIISARPMLQNDFKSYVIIFVPKKLRYSVWFRDSDVSFKMSNWTYIIDSHCWEWQCGQRGTRLTPGTGNLSRFWA